MSSILPAAKTRFVTILGTPLVGGFVYFYEPGTETPADTWQDEAMTTPNTNPVVLDARGEALIWGNGTYRQVVTDRFGVQVWDQLVTTAVSTADLSGTGGAALVGLPDGTTLAGALNLGLNRVVDSIASLRALNHTFYTRAFVTGYYAAHDGGGGPYQVDPNDSSSADNGVTIIVASDGARWKLGWSSCLTPNQGGAHGDADPTTGTGTDDTASFQNLITVLAASGGGCLQCRAGANYHIAGTLIIPSNIDFDLNGATLWGAGVTTGTMFESGYLSGGAVVSNIGTTPESENVNYSKIHGGAVRNCGQIFHFQDFNFGCRLYDLDTQNCQQFGSLTNCFYLKLADITAKDGSSVTVPTIQFGAGANNITLDRVHLTTAWPIALTQGCAALRMLGCSMEGGTKGITFVGNCYAFEFSGGYVEAIQGTAFDFTQAGTCNVKIQDNYLHLIDVIFDDGGASSAAALQGIFDATNEFAAGPGTDGGFTYRGLLNAVAPLNFIKFQYSSDNSGQLTPPGTWSLGLNAIYESTTTTTGSSTTDFLQKALVSGPVLIPRRFGGNVGSVFTGQVQYCTVANASGSVTIDTQISWQPASLFVIFYFSVADGAGAHNVYGTIYGGQSLDYTVDGPGGSAITVTLSENTSSNMRITLGITGDLSQITGTVQII